MRLRFKNISLFIVIITCVLSCGKYGYDFQDGYQEGDEESTPIVTDTSMGIADKSMYHRARVFPGLVGEGITRIKDTLIAFDMNYVNVTEQDLRVNIVPNPIFSTGLYAPAGENVKISVPSGVFGLTVQIGLHMNDISSYEPKRRDAVVYTRKELFPGDNFVKNLYGGTIWVLSNNSQSNSVALRFAGAVRSPDFIDGKTDPQEWIKDVEGTAVPWLEIRSKGVIFSVPRSLILSNKSEITQIDQAVAFWNEIYKKDFYDWMGLLPNTEDVKNRYPDLPERAVLELQLPNGITVQNGNPWVGSMNSHWLLTLLNKDYLINSTNLPEVAWRAFHAIGHNYQQFSTWNWSGLEETTNNLFVWKLAHRLNKPEIANHPAVASAFIAGINYASLSITKNMVTDAVVNGNNAQYIKILPFLQIFTQAEGKNGESGWDFMAYLYKKARTTQQSLSLDQAKRDFFYRSLCEFTGKDWRRFCKAWGIQLSTLVQQEMATQYVGIDKTLWTYNPLTKTGGNGNINPKEDLLNTEWTLLSISTEELTGEGANNGNGKHMIDGNNNTFWHSQWQNGSRPLPHTATFQLKTNEIVKGFYFVPRVLDGNQRPRSIEIQVSKDNVNYITLTNNDLEEGYSFNNIPNNADRKEFRLKQSQETRYIRIVFRENNHTGGQHHAIAEFGAFFDID